MLEVMKASAVEGNVQKSHPPVRSFSEARSSRAAALLTRGAYTGYVSTAKG